MMNKEYNVDVKEELNHSEDNDIVDDGGVATKTDKDAEEPYQPTSTDPVTLKSDPDTSNLTLTILTFSPINVQFAEKFLRS